MNILTCLDCMAIKTLFQNLWKVAKPELSKTYMALNVNIIRKAEYQQTKQSPEEDRRNK